MSELENWAKPILSKMILPTAPVVLTPDEQMMIAAWLWKTAIVHEKPSGATYFNREERACLVNSEPPTSFGVHIWIAAANLTLGARLLGGPSRFEAPDGRSTDGYVMTLSIRRFAAQLLCVREMEGTNVSTVSHYNFKGTEALIWPEQNRDVGWPPVAAVLDDELFEKWHARWNTPAS
jgi:hypothetical protein